MPIAEEEVVLPRPFQIKSWNIHGLENHLDVALAMEFDALLVQEADVEEASIFMIKQRCMQAKVHIFFANSVWLELFMLPPTCV